MPEREGGDIFASDMIVPPEEPSEISQFYANSNIFLTGGTGFLGKLIIEKLLRTCYDLNAIYVLVRPKKGKDVQTRFDEIFEGPNFDPLKRLRPNFAKKVRMVSGDCSKPDLGLSIEDKGKIMADCDIIIHCAATVRFDEKLRCATEINVKSVIDVLKMARDMKNLKALLYISTAFSNCTQPKIEERFYEPSITAEKLCSLIDSLNDDKLEKILPILLEDIPNTYVYTKSIAEDYVKRHSNGLPVAIYRPAIVIPSYKEPVAGWIDNIYGATGVLLGAAVGLIRSIQGKKENTAELVPADYVVNGAIAAVWDVASIKSINDNSEIDNNKVNGEEEELRIYNFVSSPEAKINWGNFIKYAEKHAVKVPSKMQVWHYFFALRSSRLSHLTAIFFLHTIPAYIVDILLTCLGRKPMLVNGYKKINKFVEVICYFSSRNWTFTNTNTQALWKKMSNRDQELFQFSMKDFDWDSYFYVYVRGGRVYLLKDPLDTIPEGRVKYYKLLVAHYVLMAVLLLLLYKFLAICFSFIV